MKTADSQGGLTLKMDSCSDATVNAFAGSGLRFEGKGRQDQWQELLQHGCIYNGMDLANLNAYYGDDNLMLAVPELSAKVFTVDLGEMDWQTVLRIHRPWDLCWSRTAWMWKAWPVISQT